MKLFDLLTSAFLPLTVMSTPLLSVRDAATEALQVNTAVAIRDADARAAGLISRHVEYCNIVNVITEVDCWALPKHNGNDNFKIGSFKGTTEFIEFLCYVNCEDVEGNTSWDWAVSQECYVPGYYTDDTCSRKNLGQCSWAAEDTSFGGCA